MDAEKTTGAPSVVAAVGASAGGLDAFRRFLKTVPPDSAVAFVLIQHLDPDHESLLAELVGKVTELPVQDVVERMPLEPDHVYVITPDTFLEYRDGDVVPVDSPEERHLRLPFDHFLNSLAEGVEQRACAIVLSGTGSDGAAGVRAVKEHGGLVIVQDPDEAQHHGMPSAAISAHAVDSVLPIAEMIGVLLDYASASYLERPGAGESAPTAEEELKSFLDQVLSHIWDKTGSDFSGYRPATVRRRIERRMGLTSVSDPEDYLELLESDPDELAALARDMVISVTGFFRDPEAFRVLEKEVIPQILEDARDRPVRVWVPGCATGEEAYSLAIAFREQMAHAAELDLFATDIDTEALDRARSGVYPASVVASVPPQRRRKYFSEVAEHQYQVSRSLRDTVAFAQQNILSDPPFSRMDLVSCRNLLIYLDGDVQADVRALFHFALRPTGFLFLGTSETVGASSELFEPVSETWRIYRRRGGVQKPAVTWRPGEERRDRGRPEPKPTGALAGAERALIQAAVAPSVVVDEHHRVLYVHGDLHDYLRLPPGEPELSLPSMLREDLRSRVRAGLFKALRDDEVIRVRSAHSEGDGRELLSVTVRPLQQGGAQLAVLTFERRSDTSEPDIDDEELSVARELEEELESTREELRITVEELEASNEELKASNEEIMSANEELQSTNQELETSTEELRALNEELSTVNRQLKEKIDEVEEARDDLANLLASTKLAVVFLDADLRVQRFTSATSEYMNILHADVGRSFLDLAKRYADPELERDAERVLADLTPQEAEIETEEGTWLQRRILPYRTSDDRIVGVVVALHDVTDLKETALEVERREQQQMTVKELGLRALSDTGCTELAQEACRMASRALGMELTKVLEARPDGDLKLLAGVGWEEGLIGELTLSSEGGSQGGFALRSQTPVVVEDLASDTRFQGPGLLFDHQVVAGISVPIGGTGDSPWGVLGAHTRQHRKFDRHEVDFMQSLANVLAAGVQRREYLEELHQARTEAEEALSTLREEEERKDRFLAILGHELRNPLASIGSVVEVLAQRSDEESVARAVDTIRRSVSRLSSLLDDLLDVQRVSRGKLALDPEILDLGEVVETTVETVADDARAKDQDLRRDIESVLVRGDEMRLEQVAVNLLRNAIRYTPEGGEIQVRVAHRDGHAVLEVEDDGLGFAASDAERLFEPFHQVKNHEAFESGGLGIGLTLVRQLVELHDGTVTAESKGEDRGSLFRVTLPVAAADETSADGESPRPEAEVEDLKILVVDDNRDTCDSLAELMQLNGNRVTQAFDGRSAIDTVREFEPRIILLDIHLPGMDGYAVVDELRSSGDLEGVDVIGISGFGHREARERSQRAGIEHYLVKPVDVQSLLQLLGELTTGDG